MFDSHSSLDALKRNNLKLRTGDSHKTTLSSDQIESYNMSSQNHSNDQYKDGHLQQENDSPFKVPNFTHLRSVKLASSEPNTEANDNVSRTLTRFPLRDANLEEGISSSHENTLPNNINYTQEADSWGSRVQNSESGCNNITMSDNDQSINDTTLPTSSGSETVSSVHCSNSSSQDPDYQPPAAGSLAQCQYYDEPSSSGGLNFNDHNQHPIKSGTKIRSLSEIQPDKAETNFQSGQLASSSTLTASPFSFSPSSRHASSSSSHSQFLGLLPDPLASTTNSASSSRSSSFFLSLAHYRRTSINTFSNLHSAHETPSSSTPIHIHHDSHFTTPPNSTLSSPFSPGLIRAPSFGTSSPISSSRRIFSGRSHRRRHSSSSSGFQSISSGCSAPCSGNWSNLSSPLPSFSSSVAYGTLQLPITPATPSQSFQDDYSNERVTADNVTTPTPSRRQSRLGVRPPAFISSLFSSTGSISSDAHFSTTGITLRQTGSNLKENSQTPATSAALNRPHIPQGNTVPTSSLLSFGKTDVPLLRRKRNIKFGEELESVQSSFQSEIHGPSNAYSQNQTLNTGDTLHVQKRSANILKSKLPVSHIITNDWKFPPATSSANPIAPEFINADTSFESSESNSPINSVVNGAQSDGQGSPSERRKMKRTRPASTTTTIPDSSVIDSLDSVSYASKAATNPYTSYASYTTIGAFGSDSCLVNNSGKKSLEQRNNTDACQDVDELGKPDDVESLSDSSDTSDTPVLETPTIRLVVSKTHDMDKEDENDSTINSFSLDDSSRCSDATESDTTSSSISLNYQICGSDSDISVSGYPQYGLESKLSSAFDISLQDSDARLISDVGQQNQNQPKTNAMLVPEIISLVIYHLYSMVPEPQEIAPKRRNPLSLRRAMRLFNGDHHRAIQAWRHGVEDVSDQAPLTEQFIELSGEILSKEGPIMTCLLINKLWYKETISILHKRLHFTIGKEWEKFVTYNIYNRNQQQLDDGLSIEPELELVPSGLSVATGDTCAIPLPNSWLPKALILHKLSYATTWDLEHAFPPWSVLRLKWLEFYTCPKLIPSPYLFQGGLLERVALPGCPHVFDSTVSLIAATCPNLKHLDLRACSFVSDLSITAIACGCPHLQLVNVGRTFAGSKITSRSIKALAKRTSIITLGVAGCDVDDECIWELARYRGKHLERLSLNNCRFITTLSFPSALTYMPCLSVLELKEVPAMKQLPKRQMAKFIAFRKWKESRGAPPPLLEGGQEFEENMRKVEWNMEVEITRQIKKDATEWLSMDDEDVDYLGYCQEPSGEKKEME